MVFSHQKNSRRSCLPPQISVSTCNSFFGNWLSNSKKKFPNTKKKKKGGCRAHWFRPKSNFYPVFKGDSPCGNTYSMGLVGGSTHLDLLQGPSQGRGRGGGAAAKPGPRPWPSEEAAPRRRPRRTARRGGQRRGPAEGGLPFVQRSGACGVRTRFECWGKA